MAVRLRLLLQAQNRLPPLLPPRRPQTARCRAASLQGKVMIAIKVTKQIYPTAQRPGASHARRRKNRRSGAALPARPFRAPWETRQSDELLDHEFDELGCEVFTLLRIAIQK